LTYGIVQISGHLRY